MLETRPHLDHHVILPGHLLLGKAPDSDDVPALKAAGVDAVLSIIHPTDPYRVPAAIRQGFTWAEVSILDSFRGGVPTVDQLVEAVTLMRRWRAEGRVMYLHCLLGQGRSPLVAMAYMVMGNDEEPAPGAHRLTAAIAHVRQARPQADPNVHQLRVLCEYVASSLS